MNGFPSCPRCERIATESLLEDGQFWCSWCGKSFGLNSEQDHVPTIQLRPKLAVRRSDLIAPMLFPNFIERRTTRERFLEILKIAAALVVVSAVVSLVIFFANASSMGQMSNEKLLERLTSTEETTQFNAAVELARRKEGAALSTLMSMLESEDWENRMRAAEALGALGDNRATSAMIARLNDSDSEVVEAAAAGLAEIGDQVALENLVEALNDRSRTNRWAVASAFIKIQDERAIPGLIDALNSNDIVQHHNDNLTQAIINQGEIAIEMLVDTVLNGGAGAVALAEIEKTTHNKITRFHDALKNGDLEMLARIYPFFMWLDQVDYQLTLPEQETLAAALLAYGDKDMAVSFANFRGDELFGSTTLLDAASMWAELNGYEILIKKY